MSIGYETIIFSIDRGGKTYCAVKDGAFRQRCRLQGIVPVKVVGCYAGVSEVSYILSANDFFKMQYMGEDAWKGQESILRVSGCNKMYATLQYRDELNKPDESLGSMHQVSKDEALQYDAWTYNPYVGVGGAYFICKHGNPDRNPSEERRMKRIKKCVNEIEEILGKGTADDWVQLERMLMRYISE